MTNRTDTKLNTHAEATQVGKFGLVGILNTLVDYALFIGLTKIFSLPLDRVWLAKIASGTIAILNSFYLNRRWVFKSNDRDLRAQALRFLLVTCVGVFIIQTGLVQFFSTVFPWPGDIGYWIASTLGLTKVLPGLLTREFIIKTAAFGIATLASMTWNYFLYKRVVFKQ